MALKRLNARLVDTIKFVECGGSTNRFELRDADVRGLELRVSRSGVKTWAYRYRRLSDGTKRTITFGNYPGHSLDAARRWALGIKSVVASGGDPAGEQKTAKHARRIAETFSEIADEWIERHGPNKSAGALKDDKSMLARHVRPVIGGMKACDVTKRDIIALLDSVAAKPDARGKGVGEPRKLTHRPNRVFEVVRSIFRWSVSRDMLKADPTLGVQPPIKKEKARERELSPDEIRILWAALDRAPPGRTIDRGPRGTFASAAKPVALPMSQAVALTLKLALATGQRIGEVSGIATTELDLNDTAPMWVLPGERSKNGQPNRIPLSPIAVRLVRSAIQLAGEDSAWLFPCAEGRNRSAGSGPIGAHAPTKALERSREAIGLDDFRVHDLRRTAATRMAEIGVNPFTISLVLNHVSARRGTVTGKVYNQYSYDREKREALEQWGTRLERIIVGSDGANVVPLLVAKA